MHNTLSTQVSILKYCGRRVEALTGADQCPWLLNEMPSNYILDWECSGVHINLVLKIPETAHPCIQMRTQAQKPKLTHPCCPKICYPSVSLHLSSLIHLSTFCHLSSRERKTDRERERKREKERHSEAPGWHAGGLDWYRRMWRGLSSISSPLSLTCLHSLLYISHPVYQSVDLTQPLHFFFLIHYVFHT